jgi:hypothetical protein
VKQLVLVGLLGCAHATPMAPAKSPASLAFYIGHWSCDGTSYDDKGVVEKKWPALEIRVAAEYDNWLRVGSGYKLGFEKTCHKVS